MYDVLKKEQSDFFSLRILLIIKLGLLSL